MDDYVSWYLYIYICMCVCVCVCRRSVCCFACHLMFADVEIVEVCNVNMLSKQVCVCVCVCV